MQTAPSFHCLRRWLCTSHIVEVALVYDVLVLPPQLTAEVSCDYGARHAVQPLAIDKAGKGFSHEIIVELSCYHILLAIRA